jgi:hypothetical protein
MPDAQDVLSALKYGSQEDKLEAITIARGRVNELLLQALCGQAYVARVVKSVSSGNRFAPNDRERISSAFWEILEDGKDILVCWYTTIALVDFGDVSQKCLEYLLQTSQQVISWLVDVGEKEGGALVGGIMELQIQEETIRALSKFGAASDVTVILKECGSCRASVP